MTTSYPWFLNEIASAGRENLDAGHVARYDRKEDADAGSEVTLLKKYGLNPESQLVEIGPGTGQFTVVAAEYCGRVVAADISPVMMKHLKEKIESLQLENVDLDQAGFLTYNHRGTPADFVYSRLALHHLPDFWKVIALKRIHRFIRPGGILRLWDVVYDFGPEGAEERIEAWCATGGSGIEGEWSRSELEEHVRDEHSTFRWLFEPMIEQCGFEIIDTDYSKDGIFGKYVARAV